MIQLYSDGLSTANQTLSSAPVHNSPLQMRMSKLKFCVGVESPDRVAAGTFSRKLASLFQGNYGPILISTSPERLAGDEVGQARRALNSYGYGGLLERVD